MPRKVYSVYEPAIALVDTAFKPTHVAGEDINRLSAYAIWDQIYRNVPDAFSLTQRGSDSDPIYIPAARKCIEATNRYLGKDFSWMFIGGVQADRTAAENAIDTLFRREKFRSKFSSLKRWGLVKGDAVWHVVADATAPAGRRISLHELDPAFLFPITDPNDVDKITGYHIAAPWIDPSDINKQVVRRQTYKKVLNANGPATITSELSYWEATGWDDRQLLYNKNYVMKPYSSPSTSDAHPEEDLPPEITALPVYHIANNYESGQPFGLSDICGFERLFAAVNQGISDEELSLALDGLGMFFTTAPRPSTGWALGPGSVIQATAGDTFERVSGVASVQPFQDHLKYLGGELKQALGVPDIAIGTVDVQVASSGIALALQMGPIIARNAEKEENLLAVHDHLLFDLVNGWLPAYEQLVFNGVSATPRFGEPLPIDRAAVIQEVTAMLTTTPPIISVQYARKILTDKLGYDFPADMDSDILATLQNNAKAANYDPFAARIADELAADFASQGLPSPNGAGA